MIGLDTNVLARFLLGDDREQSAAAARAIRAASLRREDIAICAPVLVELEWVLRSRDDIDKSLAIELLRELISSKNLVVEHFDAVVEALAHYETTSADFPECLFQAIYTRNGCSAMLTFDKKAQKQLANCLAP